MSSNSEPELPTRQRTDLGQLEEDALLLLLLELGVLGAVLEHVAEPGRELEDGGAGPGKGLALLAEEDVAAYARRMV